MSKSIVYLTAAILATGCANHAKMDWMLVGGSKADGNIILGIDVPPIMGVAETEVTWDTEQANLEADRRCKNWGFGGAEMYRGQFPVLKTCHPQGFSPCWSKTYRIQYQCVDAKK
ncbi:MAG: hypothetical protein LBP52_08660 [Burkholderiaceae bacterium]|nr:hypothetical protein [Burkholderiaceae bacterium]